MTIAAGAFTTDTGTAATATVAKPASVARGDLLLLAIITTDGGNRTYNALTGWTLYTSILTTDSWSPALALYVRVADGSEGSSFSPTWNASVGYKAWCQRYFGSVGVTLKVTPVSLTASDYTTAWTSAGITVGGSGSDWALVIIATEGSNSVNGPAGYSARAVIGDEVGGTPMGLFDSNGGVAASALTLTGTNSQGKQEASLIFTIREVVPTVGPGLVIGSPISFVGQGKIGTVEGWPPSPRPLRIPSQAVGRSGSF